MQPIVRSLEQLFDREFDLLVVGGGISGACAAWDAALRGMKVALIEAGDFASGASSNSLKLLHGGLRYVKRLLPREARDAVRERRTWLRIAPHLTRPIPLVVPAYGRSVQNPLFVRLLLAASDTVAWDRNHGVSEGLEIPRSRMLSRSELLRLAPALADTHPAGGAIFHDAQIRNTERLVLQVVRAAASAGAVVANYVALETSLLRNGAVVGARLVDRIAVVSGELRARAILNAAGADAPHVMQRLLHTEVKSAPRYSLALNVMIRRTALPVAVTLTTRATEAGRGRQLLWVPWRDREILGTYHRDLVEPSSRPRPEDCEIDAFLDEVNRAVPGLGLSAEEVLLVHAGTLPLATAAASGLQLLRRHRVIDHATHGAAGAVSLLSVKYTTARLAAEEAIDLVVRRLGRVAPGCETADTPLPGAPPSVAELHKTAQSKYGALLPEDIIDHLVHTYGLCYEQVLSCRDGRADWKRRVHSQSPVIYAELLHGMRDEMALTTEDLLYRRTELGARGVTEDEVVQAVASVLDGGLPAGR